MFTPQSQGVFKRLRGEHDTDRPLSGRKLIFSAFQGHRGWVKRAEIMWVA